MLAIQWAVSEKNIVVEDMEFLGGEGSENIWIFKFFLLLQEMISDRLTQSVSS